MATSIGVFIPTQGRKTLARTLQSIASQDLLPEDRVIVVGDGVNRWASDTVPQFGPNFTYTPIKATRDWGHTQCNYGIKKLQGTVTVITAQDDDDIFSPRAFEAMREQAEWTPNHLLMARVANHAWGLLWRVPDFNEPLVPNDPRYKGNMAQDGHSPWLVGSDAILPRFGAAYNGDQIYVAKAGMFAQGRTRWVPEITTITRPDKMLGWSLFAWPVRTDEQWEALRQIRNACASFMTDFTGEITPVMQDEYRKDTKDKWHWLFSFPNATPWKAPELKDYIGFAKLRHEGGFMLPTYGLLPEHRGFGYGKEIIQYTTIAAQGPLKARILESNVPSVHIHLGIGYKKAPLDIVDTQIDPIYGFSGATLDTSNLYIRPGRHISVNGGPCVLDFECIWPPKFLDFDPIKKGTANRDSTI